LQGFGQPFARPTFAKFIAVCSFTKNLFNLRVSFYSSTLDLFSFFQFLHFFLKFWPKRLKILFQGVLYTKNAITALFLINIDKEI